jgi:hypothetical protein
LKGKASLGAANRKRFLEAYAKCGVIGEAARRAKVHRNSHYLWMDDPDYQREFEAANEQATDLLVEEARRRAHDGWTEPVIYQGEYQYKLDKLGRRTNVPVTVRKFDSTLLMFLIKARKPEIYRETWKGEIKHTANVDIKHRLKLETLGDEQLEHLESMFRLSAPQGDPEAPDLCGRDSGEGTAGAEQTGPNVPPNGSVP